MSEPGLTTPVQPVGGRGGRWSLLVGLGFVLVVGLLVWHPWTPAEPGRPAAARRSEVVDASPASVALGSAEATDPAVAASGPPIDPHGFADPTTGPWSGRLTSEWSVVAVVRADPVSRDPMDLRQERVAAFSEPVPLPADLGAICDQPGTSHHPGTADLVSGEVMFLGFAFPPDTAIDAATLDRLGQPLRVVPIDLGRIPGGPAPTTADAGSARPSAGPSAIRRFDPVRMFTLPDGGTWPDGVYRFSVSAWPAGAQELFACIGP